MLILDRPESTFWSMSIFWFPLFKLCWSTSTKWETESTKWVTKQQSGSTNQQSGSTNQQVGRPRINQGGRANYMSTAQIYLFSLCLTISPNTVNSEQDYWDQQSTRFNSCFKDCKSFAISKKFWRTCRDTHAPVIIGEAAQRRPNYASKTIRYHPKTRNHPFHLEQ